MRPLALLAYGLATRALGPLIARRAMARLAAQGVAPARLTERKGQPTLPRPPGSLVWLHGASIGETLSVLPLVSRLTAQGIACLVTSGTATSAQILPGRLPPGAFHQFAPLDRAAWVARFLAHWRPDVAVFVESEIWPETLHLLDARRVPRVLMNARLSARSLARWARWPRVARVLFAGFRAIVAQTPLQYDAFADMGLTNARIGGNMKAAAGAPPHDPALLDRLAASLARRPVWAAVSTHPGEEAAALAAQAAVLARHPDALLILCPRHPDRGDEVAALIAARGLTQTRRSAGQGPGAQVYLADTLGETGLWFRLASATFLGGSLVARGGHNPWEPAACGSAIVTGPHLENVADDLAALTAVGAARILADAAALGPAVLALLADPAAARAMGAAGRAQAAQARVALDDAVALVAGLIPPAAAGFRRSPPTTNSRPESPRR